MLKTPKILTVLAISFIILQTFSFLFLKLAYSPTRAEADWKIPDLQIKISDNKKIAEFTQPSPCPGDATKKCPDWIAQYIAGIYRYAIGIIGILAVVVMMVGGIMWITAFGNTSRIGEAKAWIGASITGLVLMLSSYLILAYVNPALVNLKSLGIGEPSVKPTVTTASPDPISPKAGVNCSWKTKLPGCYINCCPIGWSSADFSKCNINEFRSDLICCCVSPKSVPCMNNNGNNVYKFDNIYESMSLPIACKSKDYKFDGYGVDEYILRSIAAQESSCSSSAKNPKGACGLMQLLPSTAGKTCDYLISNPQESIQIAAKFIRDNAKSHLWNPAKIFAGYNGGYSNKYGAPLSASKDCPGNLSYECCILPGELAETQNYVYNTIKYLNWQKTYNY